MKATDLLSMLNGEETAVRCSYIVSELWLTRGGEGLTEVLRSYLFYTHQYFPIRTIMTRHVCKLLLHSPSFPQHDLSPEHWHVCSETCVSCCTTHCYAPRWSP